MLLTHGKPCPVSDLFGVRDRKLLSRLDLREPWQGTIEASLRQIDELDRESASANASCAGSAPTTATSPCSA